MGDVDSATVEPSYEDHLVAEAATWVLGDKESRAEKLLRERIRHYSVIRSLLLDKLPTHRMDVLEIGGGPLPVSDLFPFRSRVVVDPCTESYREIAPCPDHVNLCAEQLYEWADRISLRWDLAISTNSLDHCEDPRQVVRNVMDVLRPGGYFAVLCARDNAFTHPHEAHEHSLSAAWLHRLIDEDFETVWQLDYEHDGLRYGWVKVDGKRGQPSWAILARKCVDY